MLGNSKTTGNFSCSHFVSYSRGIRQVSCEQANSCGRTQPAVEQKCDAGPCDAPGVAGSCEDKVSVSPESTTYTHFIIDRLLRCARSGQVL